ncbi:MAG: alkane 1-monooxygenase [Myxococcota bacterium]
MPRSLPYWVVYLVPIVTVLGLQFGGVGTLAGLAFIFALIPLVEAVSGLRTDNDGTNEPAGQLDYNLPLYVWVPTQVGIQLYGLSLVLDGSLVGWEAVVGTISVGVLASAGGINIAHELMHRKSRFEQGLAEVLMGSVTYTHFCVEHVYGHHRHVATPLDSASSRYNESVYAFLPRSLLGGLLSAWRIENKRAKKQGISRFSPRHRMVRYGVTQLVVYGALALALGPIALAYWAGQSLTAMVVLEVINYIEHYGLQRRELSPGRYERVKPWHSWNASHRITNWLLFNLQRHSDHHYLASRPYFNLRHYDDVPQLPAGYATMILTALVPPLWRAVMNPRVEAWTRKQATVESEFAAAA